MQDCPHCHSQGHTYSFYCLNCCARLILSTRPNRSLAQAMLASIEHHRSREGASAVPDRKAITDLVASMIRHNI